MTDLITAVNVLMSTYKAVKELYEKADSIELKSHILAMNEQILDLKEIALNLRDENTALKQEVRKIKEFDDRGLTMKNGAYFDKNSNGPYCPTCWDNEKYLSLMGRIHRKMPLSCTKCQCLLGD